MRVLLVEDDKLLAEGIEVSLTLARYTVDLVNNGEQALHALKHEQFDLLILDLGLPGVSGYEVLSQLRSQKNMIPVLILTARDHIEDKVKGLDLGADDYLLKPFDVEELKARMRALLRRPGGDRVPEIAIKDLIIDPQSHRVSRDETPIALSPKEFSLLYELATHKGRILSKDQLTELIYGWSDDPESNSIEVHIHNLRKKIGAGIVETVRGVGYRIDSI
jgi:two-component system, OmpR family, response regulator QseB